MKDWIYVGAKVIRPDGQVDEIYSISEDKGVRLEDGGNRYYCRTELKPFIDNKKQLIDKAIDDLGGDISKAGNYYFYMRGNLFTSSVTGNYWCSDKTVAKYAVHKYVCTIEEFEQRKKEREMDKTIAGNDWYDYENQKAIALPPIGENTYCQLFDSIDSLVKVVGHDTTYVVYKYAGSYYSGSISSFKPLDWDKVSKRKQAIAYAMELSPDGAKLEDIFGSLYDAGMLKLPESR